MINNNNVQHGMFVKKECYLRFLSLHERFKNVVLGDYTKMLVFLFLSLHFNSRKGICLQHLFTTFVYNSDVIILAIRIITMLTT